MVVGELECCGLDDGAVGDGLTVEAETEVGFFFVGSCSDPVFVSGIATVS